MYLSIWYRIYDLCDPILILLWFSNGDIFWITNSRCIYISTENDFGNGDNIVMHNILSIFYIAFTVGTLDLRFQLEDIPKCNENPTNISGGTQ